MLEGYLYTVLEKADGGATVRTLPESPIYAAHFPGYPITPGVCIVQMAMELTGKHLTSAKDIKFLHPVFPGQILRYDWSQEGTILASLEDGTLCAKMNVTCH